MPPDTDALVVAPSEKGVDDAFIALISSAVDFAQKKKLEALHKKTVDGITAIFKPAPKKAAKNETNAGAGKKVAAKKAKQ